MLEIIGSSLLSLWWAMFGNSTKPQIQLESMSWHDALIFQLPAEQSDPSIQMLIDQYLANLSQTILNSDRSLNGFVASQGVWIQSDWLELANHQGNIPVSAASLTKIATTLAVVGKLGIEHQFVTRVFYTGSIEKGILQGDLIIEGNRDPFFVWEEAIALSNSLNQLGIREVKGNLWVNQDFYMNYQADPLVSAKLLQQGLQPRLWSKEVQQQFMTAFRGHSQAPPFQGGERMTLNLKNPPQLTIQGEVKLINKISPSAQLLLEHQSLPLVEIIKQMNIYSNNEMAQMLAEVVGGASEVARYGVEKTGVATSEIQLVNGSGLGIANRISPRAVTKMLMAIDNLLQPHNLEVADIFPLAGRDQLGTMKNRHLPDGVAIKTGTLNEVSALAGVIPLDQGRRVWFAIINHGWQIEQFRQQQDQLLQTLADHWQLSSPVAERSHFTDSSSNQVYLGDPQRNKVITYDN
jgi:serine-type D-Ala-D-Ala carboxypeptidase/endopeptidase (penicillin-binding protein 4)